VLVWLALACPWIGTGEALADAESDLSKQTQNPVANLTSIPFQFNFYSGGGLGTQTFSNVNLQPVMPLSVSDKWNVIARTIIPFLSIPGSSGDRAYGIGDIQEQIFFTPAKSGSLIWGIGPMLSIPTATNEAVATGQTALGPTAVALKMSGHWVYGALANNIWRIAGYDQGDGINQFLIQPFINYNFGRGWALSTAPAITANWNAPEDEQWTVPIGMGISKVDRIGSRPVSLALQYYHLAERPADGADTMWRLLISFLYPKAPPHAKAPEAGPHASDKAQE
jgi:hypothetical protein